LLTFSLRSHQLSLSFEGEKESAAAQEGPPTPLSGTAPLRRAVDSARSRSRQPAPLLKEEMNRS
jgi:hypothetical protein